MLQKTPQRRDTPAANRMLFAVWAAFKSDHSPMTGAYWPACLFAAYGQQVAL